MATWCESCPNRLLALLARSVGADEVALEAERVGCNNWKRIEYSLEDRDTGQPMGSEIRELCMRDHLPAWFNSVDAKAAHAVKVAASHRNVVAEGLSYLTGRPITGDLEDLPVEFREALEAAGIGTVKALPASTMGAEELG